MASKGLPFSLCIPSSSPSGVTIDSGDGSPDEPSDDMLRLWLGLNAVGLIVGVLAPDIGESGRGVPVAEGGKKGRGRKPEDGERLTWLIARPGNSVTAEVSISH